MKSALDFLARLAFFAIAPFLLVFVAVLFPITGALAQIGVALVVFFTGEAVRALALRSRLAKMALGKFLDFEAYYRAHPPRPFLYYVFYPFLFPYWLYVKEARREFLLFKGYTVASFLLLVGLLGLQYYRNFLPELGLKEFLPIAIGTFAVETIVVLMFLMPIVTTVVHFHSTGASARLAALLAVAITAIGAAIFLLSRPRDPVVSFATRERVRMRTKAKPSLATGAQIQALQEAWKALPLEKGDVDRDGKVEGLPLEKARSMLGIFYKSDETFAFDLWYYRKGKVAQMVVYFEARGKKEPIWLAMDATKTTFHDPKRLPKGAFAAMKHAADGLE